MSTPGPGGARSALNITIATVIKATPGTLFRVVIVTPPTAAGGLYDTNTTASAAATNLIDPIGTGLAASTVLDLAWPCQTGIVVNPGAGGVVSVSYT